MTTLFWDATGPLLRYGRGVLHVEDLNPEMRTHWAMTRWEIFRIGLRCIWAAIRP